MENRNKERHWKNNREWDQDGDKDQDQDWDWDGNRERDQKEDRDQERSRGRDWKWQQDRHKGWDQNGNRSSSRTGTGMDAGTRKPTVTRRVTGTGTGMGTQISCPPHPHAWIQGHTGHRDTCALGDIARGSRDMAALHTWAPHPCTHSHGMGRDMGTPPTPGDMGTHQHPSTPKPKCPLHRAPLNTPILVGARQPPVPHPDPRVLHPGPAPATCAQHMCCWGDLPAGLATAWAQADLLLAGAMLGMGLGAVEPSSHGCRMPWDGSGCVLVSPSML